jgi:thiamine kinase-like enzyme
MNIAQFEDFIFSASRVASPMYLQFLRSLRSGTPVNCVFTHSDLRPDNIILESSGSDGTWKVVGIVDWESSGWYPEYWESIKMTNNLVPRDQFDWYQYLPETSCPKRYPIQWLVDRVWDSAMENSG